MKNTISDSMIINPADNDYLDLFIEIECLFDWSTPDNKLYIDIIKLAISIFKNRTNGKPEFIIVPENVAREMWSLDIDSAIDAMKQKILSNANKLRR